MDSAELRERLAFLGLEKADREALARLKPVLEASADRFIAAFYRHLLSFAPTRALLSDPEVKRRLLDRQREYLLSLANGGLDADYVEERVQIGRTHERVGLEPRWYLGAYALYSSLLIPLIVEEFKGRPALAVRALSALSKVLLLDAQLAVEAYIASRERELEYLTRELAQAGREMKRSYEAQGAELRETTARAQAAEELASVATVVAGLAHEIGTPMGVIQGHAEMLENDVHDDRARWRLRTIREQIDRISNIIKTLLNMARPQPTQIAPVDLARVIDSSLEFVGEKLRRRGIEVDPKLDFEGSLDGDAEKLQQLFLNLFLNAADAMPEGGRLGVSLEAVDGEQSVRVRVADSGQGVPPELLDRVFEPFVTSKPAGQGSGLGLMVVRSIAQEHGGSIEVSSEPGRGTAFTITLPLREAQSSST